MPGTTDLTAGQSIRGNLVFELPKSAKPVGSSTTSKAATPARGN